MKLFYTINTETVKVFSFTSCYTHHKLFWGRLFPSNQTFTRDDASIYWTPYILWPL